MLLLRSRDDNLQALSRHAVPLPPEGLSHFSHIIARLFTAHWRSQDACGQQQTGALFEAERSAPVEGLPTCDKRLPGQRDEPAHVGLPSLDVLRNHFQAVQLCCSLAPNGCSIPALKA